MLNKEPTDREVFSSDRKTFFKIVENADKSFSLRKYIVCYDPEEEVEYTVRQEPDPTSRYQKFAAAVQEARFLLK